MNKQELARFLARQTGLAESMCDAVLTEVLAAVIEALVADGKVDLEDFGIFRLTKQPSPDGMYLIFDPQGFLADAASKPMSGGFVAVTETQHIQFPSRAAVRKADESSAYRSSARLAFRSSARLQTGFVTLGKAKVIEAVAANQAAAGAAPVPPEGTDLSPFAQEVLGLEGGDIARGFGLSEKSNPLAGGRKLTFPVRINRVHADESPKWWRPVDGDYRREMKDLHLKNHMLCLGSIVQDHATTEPMIVFDVAHHAEAQGERFSIRLMKVRSCLRMDQDAPAGQDAPNWTLMFEEVDFDVVRHDVVMAIDEVVGPHVHSFNIGSFFSNDRKERAQICLSLEYENYLARLDAEAKAMQSPAAD